MQYQYYLNVLAVLLKHARCDTNADKSMDTHRERFVCTCESQEDVKLTV